MCPRPVRYIDRADRWQATTQVRAEGDSGTPGEDDGGVTLIGSSVMRFVPVGPGE